MPKPNPACTVIYDGIDDGLFDFSNESCVSLWLLYQYADQSNMMGKACQRLFMTSVKYIGSIGILLCPLAMRVFALFSTLGKFIKPGPSR